MLVAMCQEIGAWLFCFYCIDILELVGCVRWLKGSLLGWCGAPSEQRVWKAPTRSRRSDEMRGTPKIISKNVFFCEKRNASNRNYLKLLASMRFLSHQAKFSGVLSRYI